MTSRSDHLTRALKATLQGVKESGIVSGSALVAVVSEDSLDAVVQASGGDPALAWYHITRYMTGQGHTRQDLLEGVALACEDKGDLNE